jgi:3-deoxy-D-manno-octulosonic-acid transferase
MSVLPLIESLRRRFPALPLVLSTVTETGRQVAAERVGGRIGLFYLPFDLVPFVKKTLRDLHPRLVILVESEIWPNLLALLHRDCIPVCLVNGRLSERSFRRYRLLPRFFHRLLSPLAAVGAQSSGDRDRFLRLGVPKERLAVTGNLKFDQPEPAGGEGDALRRAWGVHEDPVLVAGSTHRGEEKVVLEAFQMVRQRYPQFRLLLAPRHPERVPEVEALLKSTALRWCRRTELAPNAEVLILDTVGELASTYALATVAFVGGSVVSVGGHNPLEPALRRKPILSGPHLENFREIARLLNEAGAAWVVQDSDTLAQAILQLAEDPAQAGRMGERAYQVVAQHRGAADRTLAMLEPYLSQ